METTTKKLSRSNSKTLVIVLASVVGLVVVGGSIFLMVWKMAVKNKIVSNLQMDNASFVVTQCRSGAALGFSGIQLSDAAGRHVRVVVNPVNGNTTVALFPAQNSQGEDLGACGELVMNPQYSNVNGVRNQQGTVTFSCAASGYTLSGTVDFKNCH